MGAAITLTGLSANDPVPGAYIEVNFAQGDAAGSGSPVEVLLMGNKLTAGIAVNDTEVYGPDSIVQMQDEDDVIALFGAGSELHRMWRRFVKFNKDVTVRAIAITESAGANAAITSVISNVATGNGNVRLWVGDEFVDVPVFIGDTVDAIGAAIVLAAGVQTHWAVTVTYNAGTDTLTITAKQKGPRGNEVRVQLVPSPGIGTAFTNILTDTALTGGATADSNATALATVANARYYYQVPAAGDATQLGAITTQINSLALPTSGNRQRVIAGSVDTLGNTTTIATGRNAARVEMAWQEKSLWTGSELAANQASMITLFETKPNPRTNFCNFGQDARTSQVWTVPAQRLKTAWPSRTSVKSALNNGISPIACSANGSTYLVNRITTRSLNGAVNDYRIRAAHKVTICDFFADDLLAKTVLQFSGRRIMSNPLQGQRPPGPDVVTPDLYKGAVFVLLDDYDTNNLLDRVDLIKAGTICQRATNPTTRIECRIPLRTVDNAEQFAIALDQVA